MDSNRSSSCHFDPIFAERLLNFTLFNSTEEFDIYLCEYEAFRSFRGVISYCLGCINIIMSVLGFMGSLLTLCTMWRNDEFSSMSFMYFQAIATLECFHCCCICFLGHEALNYRYFITNELWYWVGTRAVSNAANFIAACVDCFIIFLSIERMIICSRPATFLVFKSRKLGLLVCTIALAAAVFTAAVSAVTERVEYAPKTGEYTVVLSAPEMEPYAEGLMMFMCALALLVLVSTLGAVIAMLHLLKKRQQLRRQVSDIQLPNGTRFFENSDEYSEVTITLNLQLCYLQLTQALPAAVNYILFAVQTFRSVNTDAMAQSVAENYPGSSAYFQRQMALVLLKYRTWYLQFFLNLSNDLAHCAHFYLYLMFSESFRYGFADRAVAMFEWARNKLNLMH